MPPKNRSGTSRTKNSGKTIEKHDEAAERAGVDIEEKPKRRKSDTKKEQSTAGAAGKVSARMLPKVPKIGTAQGKTYTTPKQSQRDEGAGKVDTDDDEDLHVAEGATIGTTPSGGTVAVPSFMGKLSEVCVKCG